MFQLGSSSALRVSVIPSNAAKIVRSSTWILVSCLTMLGGGVMTHQRHRPYTQLRADVQQKSTRALGVLFIHPFSLLFPLVVLVILLAVPLGDDELGRNR